MSSFLHRAVLSKREAFCIQLATSQLNVRVATQWLEYTTYYASLTVHEEFVILKIITGVNHCEKSYILLVS